MIIKKIRKALQKRRAKRGQTALEYALVIGAISLVVMTSWNIVGERVRDGIENSILPALDNNIREGNNTSF